ncbi:hypothetical protein HaLaN_32226 [Haematococcus lacustris]|uniref:Uncharacterized protein n=1 Tax=Haematococcus lacustris TaxID=44745 RepID=A0A6A0AK14_HAELA|nr:hypothetical protein HaLaN_32226 [Haematococcus lacustris]
MASADGQITRNKLRLPIDSGQHEKLRLPQIAILVGAGVAACSDYRSGPKLPPRVKVSPKATAINKLAATTELPRGASIPTRALEPWHTLGLLASSLVFASATGW